MIYNLFNQYSQCGSEPVWSVSYYFWGLVESQLLSLVEYRRYITDVLYIHLNLTCLLLTFIVCCWQTLYLNTPCVRQLYKSIFTEWRWAVLKCLLPFLGVQLSHNSCPIYRYLVIFRMYTSYVQCFFDIWWNGHCLIQKYLVNIQLTRIVNNLTALQRY